MEEYTISSGNVFNDLGFANAKEKLAKAKLAAIINKLIEDKGLTRKEAAQILALSQEQITCLQNGRLRGFSMERLFSFLQALDQHIEITITDRSKVKRPLSINVAYV